MAYLGDFLLDTTDLSFGFTSRASTGVPKALTLAEVQVTKAGTTTVETSTATYITINSTKNNIVGYNTVDIDLAGAAFFSSERDYSIVLSSGTVNSVDVSGEELATFSILNRNMRGTDSGALEATLLAKSAETQALFVTYGLDHLVAAAVTSDDVVNDSIMAQLASDESTAVWATFKSTRDSLEALQVKAGAVESSLATLANANSTATDALVISGSTGTDALFVTYGLDHLVSAAVTSDDVVDGSVIAQMVSKNLSSAVFATFKSSDDSLEAIRDRGDAGWITAIGFSTSLSTEVAFDVWDQAVSDHVASGSVGRALQIAGVILAETTASGVPTTTTLPLTAGSAVDDFYTDLQIIPLGGNLAGQARVITAYDGGTKTITVDEAWTSAIANGDAVVIKATHMHSVSQIADGVWDEILTGATHNIATSAGRRLRQLEAAAVIHTGTAQAGTFNTITLDTGGSTRDDFYNHTRVLIVDGTAIEQERIIVNYTGASRVAKVAPPWIVTPDVTSIFEIEPALVHAETGWATIKIGIVQASSNASFVLDAEGSTMDDFYNNDLVKIDSGVGEGQAKVITDYTGATKLATVDSTWAIVPSTADEYIIEEGHPYVDVALSVIQATMLTAAEMNAEVVDALATDTYAESTAVPVNTKSLAGKITDLHDTLLNPLRMSSSAKTFYTAGDNFKFGKVASQDSTGSTGVYLEAAASTST